MYSYGYAFTNAAQIREQTPRTSTVPEKAPNGTTPTTDGIYEC